MVRSTRNLKAQEQANYSSDNILRDIIEFTSGEEPGDSMASEREGDLSNTKSVEVVETRWGSSRSYNIKKLLWVEQIPHWKQLQYI